MSPTFIILSVTIYDLPSPSPYIKQQTYGIRNKQLTYITDFSLLPKDVTTHKLKAICKRQHTRAC
jgi:hypothetical protein